MPMEQTTRDQARWRPISEGVMLAPLRLNKGVGSFLLRFEAGSRSLAHIHPGGEEVYVVSGVGRLDGLAFGAGDFIYTPPGEAHTLYAETEVLIHVSVPEPVVFIESVAGA